MLVHYNSNSVILENCDIFILVYYIILISWSVESRIDILNPGTVFCDLKNIESGVKKKKIKWLKNIVLLCHFLLESGFDKLWRQNIELIIYFIPITYGGTKYYGRNILTHPFVIAITEKVQIIAMVFHITLHALNYRPWVTFSVQ